MLYNYGIPYTLNGGPTHLPIFPVPPEPPSCPEGTIYTVRQGDTMFRIANHYNIPLQKLLRANPQVVNPNIIYVGQRLCVPVADKALPAGVCCICLTPVAPDALGATVYIDYKESALWTAAFGLPAPIKFDEIFCVYSLWLVDRSKAAYLKTGLKACAPGIEAGHCKFATGLEGYDEIIVTPEPVPIPSVPSGPIVLKGNTNQCL